MRAQGVEISDDADPHIVADGRRREPIRISPTRLAFTLPAGREAITLNSNVFIPAHTRAESDDGRELGLCVARLQIDGENVALDADALTGLGWHEPECDDGRFQRRWTRRAAQLPAGARLVLVDLAGLGYYWRKVRFGRIAQVV